MKRKVIKPPAKLMGGPETLTLQSVLSTLISGGIKQLILDMSQVQWINSAGLGLLIRTQLECRKCGSLLVLLNPSPKVRSMLAITKLGKVFEVRSV